MTYTTAWSVRVPRRVLWLVLLLIGGSLLAVASPAPVAAQFLNREPSFTGEDCDATYERIVDTNRAYLLRLDCQPGWATDHDEVSVYALGSDLFDSTLPWQDNVDFINEVWSFDVGANGAIALLIHFHRGEDGALLADLYTDPDGDQRVEYGVALGQLDLFDTEYWTVRVTAADGWWQRDDMLNYNLTVEIDGDVQGMVRSHALYNLIATDGVIDVRATIEDADGNGNPDYDLRQLVFPNVPGGNFERTMLTVNPYQAERPAPDRSYVFWEHLSSARLSYVRTPNRDGYASIQMDWAAGTLVAVTQFVGSHVEDHWYMQSFNAWEPDGINNFNFENPVGFYNLSGDIDGWPEVHARVTYRPPGDDSLSRQGLEIGERPALHYRYSWRQDDDQLWDYQFSVLGNHQMTDVVTVGDLQFYSIPYADIPGWMMERTWQMADFVVVRDPDFNRPRNSGTEGLYEVIATNPRYGWFYLYGKEGGDLNEITDEQVRPGISVQYSREFNDEPTMYLSPVDYQMHMRSAETGRWNVDNESFVFYGNVVPDRYIDQWTYVQRAADPDAPPLTRRLTFTPQHMIYSDGEELLIREVQIAPSLFEMSPPASNAEWQQLNEQLERHQTKSFAAGDLRGMAEQFAGATTALANVAVTGLQVNGSDFQFVLDITDTSEVATDDLGVLDRLTPGTYAVRYSDGAGFSVLPATAPELDLDLQVQRSNFEQQLHVLPPMIAVELANTGQLDVLNSRLQLTASQGDATFDVLDSTTQVLPDQTRWVPFDWQMSGPEQWDVSIVLREGDGTIVDERALSLDGLKPETFSLPTLLEVSGQNGGWLLGFVLLLLLGGVIAATVFVLTRDLTMASRAPHDDETV